MQNNRRKFLKNSFAHSFLAIVGWESMVNVLSSFTLHENNKNGDFNIGFEQKPLPYSYNALEDCIDTQTMEIHYTKHAAAYAKNLNDAVLAEKVQKETGLETILANISTYSVKMRNNAGGHFNHELFWQCMQPKTVNNLPKGNVLMEIEKAFGDFASFKKLFSDAGKTRFGSGWAWLVKDETGKLKITSTANQDNPLMDLKEIEIKGTPILCLDVWEHAYYLKYQNKRADYIEQWWNLVNWNFVEKRMTGK
jgi:Fe-Mn family superoxide dismutase